MNIYDNKLCMTTDKEILTFEYDFQNDDYYKIYYNDMNDLYRSICRFVEDRDRVLGQYLTSSNNFVTFPKYLPKDIIQVLDKEDKKLKYIVSYLICTNQIENAEKLIKDINNHELNHTKTYERRTINSTKIHYSEDIEIMYSDYLLVFTAEKQIKFYGFIKNKDKIGAMIIDGNDPIIVYDNLRLFMNKFGVNKDNVSIGPKLYVKDIKPFINIKK